jgi:CheY-like chemotaxis protein
MGKDILNLKPSALWKNFYSLTQIPRPSKSEGAVRDFVVKFGKDLGLETIVDEDGNTRYKVPELQKLKPADTSRILIADDEIMVRRVFCGALKRALPDLVIDEAENGKQAVALFSRYHHGLVILDCVMPEMTGEESFKAIRSHCSEKCWQLPPCVFCTGYQVTPSLRALIDDSDVHVCLTKPLGIADLIKTVTDRLSGVGRA